WKFEQIAGFHGLKALLMQWLRREFIRWLWENQGVPDRYKKTVPFSPNTIHHKTQQRYGLVPFLRLRLQSNCNLKKFQSV
ncbi:hypothetical protein, partial [Endozoicomonas sp. ALC013]|uniref:hypothetical protein n=1 Tax=Endozoicomonas sp. ALC013 TaxID=3403076 RepID=UPI003BB57933